MITPDVVLDDAGDRLHRTSVGAGTTCGPTYRRSCHASRWPARSCSLVAWRPCGDDAAACRRRPTAAPATDVADGYGSPPAPTTSSCRSATRVASPRSRCSSPGRRWRSITGDGLALSTGPVPAIFPGPLLPNVLQRTITADGDPGRCWRSPTSSGCSPTSPTPRNNIGRRRRRTPSSRSPSTARRTSIGRTPSASTTMTIPTATASCEFVDGDDRPAGDRRCGPARSGGAVRRRRVPDPGHTRRPRHDDVRGRADRRRVARRRAGAARRRCGLCRGCPSTSATSCSPTPRP